MSASLFGGGAQSAPIPINNIAHPNWQADLTGATDTSAAFTAAIAYLAANGITELQGNAGDIYQVKNVISSVKIDLRGGRFKDAALADYCFLFRGYNIGMSNAVFDDQGNLFTKTSLSVGVGAGTFSTITVADVSRAKVGMNIFVDVDANDLRYRTIITSIVGNQITLRDAIAGPAALGSEVVYGYGALWMEDLTWWWLKEILFINTTGGIFIKPSSTATASNKGDLENIKFDGTKYFQICKVENAGGVKYTNVRGWGGWVETTNAVGNGTAGPFTVPTPVFLLRDLTVTVNGVAKTRGVHWNFASTTSITFTLGNYPASGAAIQMQNFRDGYRGIVDDERNTAILSGGNGYYDVEVLDCYIGGEFVETENTDIDGVTFDTCQYIAAQFTNCTFNTRVGKLWLGYSANSMKLFGTASTDFNNLYTLRVPAVDTVLGTVDDNIYVDATSKLRITADNWTGGDYQINNAGAVNFSGGTPYQFNSNTTIAAGTNVYLTQAGQQAAIDSPYIIDNEKQALQIVANVSAAPGAGKNFKYKLYVNGNPTTRELTITGAATFTGTLLFAEGINKGSEIAIYAQIDAGAAVAKHRVAVFAKAGG